KPPREAQTETAAAMTSAAGAAAPSAAHADGEERREGGRRRRGRRGRGGERGERVSAGPQAAIPHATADDVAGKASASPPVQIPRTDAQQHVDAARPVEVEQQMPKSPRETFVSDEPATPRNLPEIPPVTSVLPADSGLELVETRHAISPPPEEESSIATQPK